MARFRLRFQFGLRTLAVVALFAAIASAGYRRHLAYQALDLVQAKAKFVRPTPKTKGWRRLFDGGIWRVHHLSFHGSPGITDEEVHHVRHLVSLRRLSLHRAAVTDKCAQALRRLTKLEALSLQGTQVTDKCIADLATLQQLQSLSLRETAITDEALKTITQFPKLEVLLLDQTNITPNGLPILQGLPRLERLTIRWLGRRRTLRMPQDLDLHGLAHLTRLRELNLEAFELTDPNLDWLEHMTQLEKLNLRTGFGEFDPAIWQRLDSLRELRLITSESLRIEIDDHRQLEMVDFSRERRIRDSPEAALTLQSLPKLRNILSNRHWNRIELRNLPSVRALHLSAVEGMAIESVGATSLHLSGTASVKLQDCPQVADLVVIAPKVAEETFVQLGKLPGLRNVTVHSTDSSETLMDAAWIRHLHNAPHLAQLSLSGISVDDSNVEALLSLPVTYLGLVTGKITQPAARRLTEMSALQSVSLPSRQMAQEISQEFQDQGVFVNTAAPHLRMLPMLVE